jgi:hypothetical protein
MKSFLTAVFFAMWSTFAYAQGTVILLVDVSSSINEEQMVLQIDSYSNALNGVAAIRSKDVVAITFSATPKIISNGDYLDAQNAFQNYNILPAELRGHTCLSGALRLIEEIAPSLQQPVVLDISGDGEANCEGSPDIQNILDGLLDNHGFQINTLFIRNDILSGSEREILSQVFYQSMVRGGGFSMVVESFFDFEVSLFEKLQFELSWIDEQLRME